MLNGDLFLMDEISLADDAVLERLNSLLEPEREIHLAERGAAENSNLTSSTNIDPHQQNIIQAHLDFQFLATMNPGGDYGKKELSPALRNRFTEIWSSPNSNPTLVHDLKFESSLIFFDWLNIVRHNLKIALPYWFDKPSEFLDQFSLAMMKFIDWFMIHRPGGSFGRGCV